MGMFFKNQDEDPEYSLSEAVRESAEQIKLILPDVEGTVVYPLSFRDKIAESAMTALIQSSPMYRDHPNKLAQHSYKIAEEMIICSSKK